MDYKADNKFSGQMIGLLAGNIACFLLSAGRCACLCMCVCVCLCILTFQSFRNAIRVSNSLDLDQTPSRCLSGMIWLQLSADDKCIPIVKRNAHTVYAEFIWRHMYIYFLLERHFNFYFVMLFRQTKV